MERKAVFFDIDGTLLDYRHGIPESTKKAIEQLQERGHLAFINTGRGRANVGEDELEGLNFNGIIAGCGTYVEYDGKCVFNREIDLEVIKKIDRLLEKYRVRAALEGSKSIYYFKRDENSKDPFITYLSQVIGDRLACVEESKEKLGVNKLSVKMEEEYIIKSVKKELEDDFDFIKHQSDFFEIIPKGYNKAKGVEIVCEKLQIDIQNTYAFGDSNNDLDMLRHVRYGVAMGNSTPETIAVSDYVTDDILKDGIYNGLKYYGLI
jgi:Cof subfamily protein (haloacid dehalogenase superfamily)